jgi:hypothetical protein
MRKTALLCGSLSKQPDSDPAILADEAGAETAGEARLRDAQWS